MTETTNCKDGTKIKVYCAHSKIIPTDMIKRNPRNPNQHPAAQIDMLGKTIKTQGWRAPITVSNRSGLIVKGHGRLDAAILIECEQCPVDYQEYETDADELADLLADNKIAELSNIESELELTLKQFLIDEEFDLELAGFGVECLDSTDDDSNSACNDDCVDSVEDNRLEIFGLSESNLEVLYNEMSDRGLSCRILKL